MWPRISVRFCRFPVERLSMPRTWSPCARTARARDDPMKPATPVMRYVDIDIYHNGRNFNVRCCRKHQSNSLKRMAVNHGANFLPELFFPGPGPGREGENAGLGVFLRQEAHGIVQLVVGEPVTLGGDDQMRAPACTQEVDELFVVLLRRHADVYQRQAKRQSWTLVEIRIDESGPL